MLSGRTIMVTRARAQAAELVRALELRGATTVSAPAIRITAAPARALDEAIDGLVAGDFEWLLLTSRSGAEALARRLEARAVAAEALHTRVAAIGEGTAAALRELGVEPALVPPTFTTRELVRSIPSGAGRVLLARADIAPDGMEAALVAKGWTPVRVTAYRTRLAARMPAAAERALLDGPLDAVTFTSASTVNGFLRMTGTKLMGGAGLASAKLVCIGPVTARTLRRAGLPVAAVASPHTIEGLIRTLERTLGRPGEESS